jgi:SAM-dependent methyltransferase
MFTLDNVVPWGRSFEEYSAIFALTGEDLKKRILGCGDGPAGFNARLTRQGGRVVSADPLYRFSAKEIRGKIDAAFDEVLDQTRKNCNEFLWTSIRSVEELGAVRMAAMEEFLVDYPAGLKEGRYLQAALPSLPFEDRSFDLALCSHLLFLYSEQFPLEFHLEAVRELCRVAREVRIFPLLELGAITSRHLEPLIKQLETEGYSLETIPVNYEFQKGGNKMLKVSILPDSTNRKF